MDPARGITGKEIATIMRALHKTAKKKARAAPRQFKGGVRYQWDNARPHKWAERQLGYKFVRIPPYSPDFNKVVEHQFNIIKRAFQKRVFGDLRICNFTSAACLLEQVVKEVVKVNALRKDAASMKDTLTAVHKANGGWAPPNLS